MTSFISRLFTLPLLLTAVSGGTTQAMSQHRMVPPSVAVTQTAAKEAVAGIQCPLPGADKAAPSRQQSRSALLPVATQQATAALNYVGPTANITAVANAIGLRAKSLTTEVAFKSGIAVSRPVTITLEYSSPAGQYRAPTQNYDTCSGNKFLHNDPMSGPAKSPAHAMQGKPRQMSIKVTLTEDKPEGQPHVYTIALTANLDPHIDIHYDSNSTISMGPGSVR